MLDNSPKNKQVNPDSEKEVDKGSSPDKKNDPKTDLSKLKLSDIKEVVGSGRFDQSFDREIDRGAEKMTKTMLNQTLDSLGLRRDNTRIQHQEKVRIDFQQAENVEMELKRDARKKQEIRRKKKIALERKLTAGSRIKGALAKSLVGRIFKRTLDSFMDSSEKKKKLFDLKSFAKKLFSKKTK